MRQYSFFLSFGLAALVGGGLVWADGEVAPDNVVSVSETLSPVTSSQPNQQPVNNSTSKSELEKSGLYPLGGTLLIDRNVQVGNVSISSLTATNASLASLAVSTITLASSATITNLTVGSLTTSGTLGKLVKWTWAHTQTNTTTTSATFVDTALTASFTMLNSGDSLWVFVFGTLRSSSMSNSGATLGLKRDSTDLLSQGTTLTSGVIAAVPLEVPVATFWVDTPGDTSAHTYTARLLSVSGITASFPDSKDSAMLIVEVTP